MFVLVQVQQKFAIFALWNQDHENKGGSNINLTNIEVSASTEGLSQPVLELIPPSLHCKMRLLWIWSKSVSEDFIDSSISFKSDS